MGSICSRQGLERGWERLEGDLSKKSGVIVSYKVGNRNIRNAARALVKSSKKSYARLSRLEEGYVPYVVQ